jgi:hypothetical protein
LDKPGTYEATDKEGFTYTATIGAKDEASGQLYARLHVAYTPPAEPTREEIAADIPEAPQMARGQFHFSIGMNIGEL